MSDVAEKIDFRYNSQHVSSRITKTFQRNSTDFFRLNDQIIEEYGRMRWQELRQLGHDMRLHTIEHLAEYLEILERKVIENGGHVHWARSAEEARRIVLKIAQDQDVKRIVKVKSMTSEEINLNPDLIKAGLSVVETDLGEFIVQIAGQRPSHITAPALHMTKDEIAELFNTKLGVQIEADPVQMSQVAASRLRQEFLNADMGISGGNFLVAETGTLVLVTNEGNGRMCTTLPRVHVAVVGIEKVLPDWQSLAIVLSLLPRNATAQKMTSYVSLISGLNPANPGEGPTDFHLVLLDNGRSKILADRNLRETLLCIRCGACLDACPIYSTVGGHAYGTTYPGPIGAIVSPQLLGLQAAGGLAFASTLCGACIDVCAVKIPITDILLQLRQQVVEQRTDGSFSQQNTLRWGAGVFGSIFGSARLYQWAVAAAKMLQAPFRHDGWLSGLPSPMNRWTDSRPLPVFKADFRSWWRDSKGKK
jgi:L-lactate dehydrogenase complex protein LldF